MSRMLDTGRTMTVPRALWVLLMLTSVGVAEVLLRGQTARASNRVQKIHREYQDARHRLWQLELELAVLRDPQRIRERAEALRLDVVPPSAEPTKNADRSDRAGGR
ncbi:MAG: hypothetical protein L6Q92_01325 [Phycisphaerae bacterium]|nr:hypothetical protein [Phycisphaerae bacterium]